MKSLKDKAKDLPNVQHDQEIRNRDRTIDSLKEQIRKANVRVRIAEQELADNEARIDFCSHFEKPPRIGSVDRLPKAKSRGPASACIVMADWHVEERVDAHVVCGLNAFNLEIAEQRIRRTFERALGLLEVEQQLSRIEEIVLAVLGDLITGYIHEELEESNYLSPTEASLFVYEQLVWGIEFLLKNTKLPIRIPTANGNHGRTSKKRRVSTAYRNSFEWLLYQQVSKRYVGHPRIQWIISPAYHNYVNIQGKVVRFHHGDAIRYQGGVGGITIPVLKAIASWDRTKHADLDLFGHYHQKLFHHKFIACNCLIGTNAYAIEIKAEYSPPSQTFVVIDKNRPSWVTAKEIYCD